MVQITLITLGTLKDKFLSEAVSEYKKKLSPYAKTDEINIKEYEIKDEDDSYLIRHALDIEADKIISQIPKNSHVFALCIEGKQYDSIELADEINKASGVSGKLCFIIGSSHGLSDKVKSICNTKLSFSKLTFPHQLMRVILLEAIYRSFTIIAGKKYHK